MADNLLSLIIFTPLVGAITIALLADESIVWSVSFLFSLLPLALGFYLLAVFNPDNNGFQFTEHYSWIPQFGISYHVGVDGISAFLVAVVALLVSVALLYAGCGDIRRRAREFCFFVLTLETGMLGTLLAIDLFLFYVFWELVLIPAYFIIGIWGSERRVYAAFKFVLYTLLGSLLMLVGIIYLGLAARKQLGAITFDLPTLYQLTFSKSEARWLFAAFALGFGVKIPIWPFHSWLPDAYSEAPASGSMLLAGAMFQMGVYAFLRFAIPLFPTVAQQATPLFVALAVIGILYGGLLALAQSDLKRLLSYASISHAGFMVLGLFALNRYGVDGTVYQLITHGFATSALFALTGLIRLKYGTQNLLELGGLWRLAPLMAATFMVAMLSSVGLPGLDGFVGEFLVLIGAYLKLWQAAAVGALGLILSAVYMLRAYERAMFGAAPESYKRRALDLNRKELAPMVPLVALILVLGIFPTPVLRRVEPSLVALLAHVYSAPAQLDSLPHENPKRSSPSGVAARE